MTMFRNIRTTTTTLDLLPVYVYTRRSWLRLITHSFGLIINHHKDCLKSVPRTLTILTVDIGPWIGNVHFVIAEDDFVVIMSYDVVFNYLALY